MLEALPVLSPEVGLTRLPRGGDIGCFVGIGSSDYEALCEKHGQQVRAGIGWQVSTVRCCPVLYIVHAAVAAF